MKLITLMVAVMLSAPLLLFFVDWRLGLTYVGSVVLVIVVAFAIEEY